MVHHMRRGAISGALVALLIILSQPFHPIQGLIPELTAFLVTMPLWIAAVAFKSSLTPILEGGAVLVYAVLVGGLLGVAFGLKRLWGWLFLLTLVIHHYMIYDLLGRQMGEVIQSVLNYFG
ncbi:MAG: hypothetical protein HY584_02915 [Candidatus Omnitrophica bacterium]|nr:hypothetical protein [Candidatus Omnitrophota bacterium]